MQKPLSVILEYLYIFSHLEFIAIPTSRLDPNITDNMISLDGYDVIRKGRSRNGGGVCIYLRGSINYKIRKT